MNVTEFDQEAAQIEDFLALPKTLYSQKTITQNPASERALLEGTHVLSPQFRLRKFLVYRETEEESGKKEAIGRCVVTLYPGEEVAYLGFFECIDDAECAQKLFECAETCAREAHRTKLIGPVDCSFWIKYRLKIDEFVHEPYTGEPYNCSYYPEYFIQNGYTELQRWVSNHYTRVPFCYPKTLQVRQRLRRAKQKRYQIRSIPRSAFEANLGVLYDLVMETFQGFLLFRAISREAFFALFLPLKDLMSDDFLWIAYAGEEPVGFYVALPDVQNLPYRTATWFRNFQIMGKRLWCRQYVLLYLGVKRGHQGLGGALAMKFLKAVYVRRSRSIGALIRKGNFTERYGREAISGQTSYALFQKNL